MIIGWHFVQSCLKFYQFLDARKRGLKDILSEVDSLIKKGYGTYNEIIQLTPREIEDIRIVLVSKQQEAELEKALGQG